MWSFARAARTAAALGLAAALSGCGYALVGSARGTLPESVRTLHVPAFVNDTARVGLEQRITEAVLRELSARARLSPVSSREGADAELKGRLLSYTAQAVRFDGAGRALEFEILVTAKVTLVERSTEKVLFENPSFVYRQPYTVPSTAGGYLDVETAAIETLARPFARSLVTTILEGF